MKKAQGLKYLKILQDYYNLNSNIQTGFLKVINDRKGNKK